jgi:spore coat protein U-like protein
MPLIRPLGALLALVVALLWGQGAMAQSCTAQVSDFNFGTVSLRAGAVNQTVGSVRIDCTSSLLGGAAVPVGVCLTFGGGSASDGGMPPRRFMQGASGSLLEYQLRPYGNGNAGGSLTTLFTEVLVLAGRGSATLPIYADVLTKTVDVPTGPYQASFSGAGGVTIKTGVLSCNLLGQEAPVPAFRVSADVASSCQIDVTALDFGNLPAQISGPVDKTATVNVRCTDNTPYRVSLGLGSGAGVTSPAARKMRNLAASLTYGLFQDAGRAIPWGDLTSNNVAGTGIGANQAYTIFGRIFGGQAASVGIYTDNVVVTITY